MVSNTDQDTPEWGNTKLDQYRSHNKKEIERLNANIQEEVIKNAQAILKDEDINFSENLSNSFEASMEGEFHTVETKNKYANLVEFGMTSGTNINFNALKVWVEGKLGISGDEAELDNVTWKIYHKIMRDGIPPKRFFKKSIKKLIGEHGKATVSKKTGQNKKPASGFGKKLNNVMKGVKKLIKAFKQVKRGINKTTKPLSKAYRRGVKKR